MLPVSGLVFSKTGHFPISPYCVILQAREQLRKKSHVESTTICILTDTSKVHELLPKPERRQDNRNPRKGATPIISLSTTMATELTTKSSLIIEYPSEVEILQNASFLARVAEPNIKIEDTKIK